jgi:hypothetical protein
MSGPSLEPPARGRIWGALLIATALVAPGSLALAGPPAPPPPAAAGMTIHRDPATGQLVAPPAGAAALPRTIARPTAMTERIGLSRGGGVLLDGIPRMGVAVEVGPNGAPVTHCDRAPAREAE